MRNLSNKTVGRDQKLVEINDTEQNCREFEQAINSAYVKASARLNMARFRKVHLKNERNSFIAKPVIKVAFNGDVNLYNTVVQGAGAVQNCKMDQICNIAQGIVAEHGTVGEQNVITEQKAMSNGSLTRKKLQQTALNLLGEKFYNYMLQFFLNFICAPHTYKIIKTRRTFILFQIFARILLGDNADEKLQRTVELAKDVTFNGKVYTDIYLYSQKPDEIGQNCNKKHSILIIDDILIHGRALSELVTYLNETCNIDTDNIDARVFAEYKDAEAITPELQKCMYDRFDKDNADWVSIKCDTVAWQTLSNTIVELIQRCNCAYTAFTDGYIVPESITEEELKQKFDVINGYNIPQAHLQKNTGMSQELYSDFDINAYFANLDCSLPYIEPQTIIRKYNYNSIKKIVPFTLLPVMQETTLKDIMLCVFADYMKDNKIHIDVTLRNSICFGYKLFSYLLSDFYVRDKLGDTVDIQKDKLSCSLYSFNISDRVTDNVYKNQHEWLSVFKCYIDNNSYYSDLNLCTSWSESANILISILNNTQITDVNSICKVLFAYIDAVHKQNENRALYGKARLKGISIHNMFGLFYDAVTRNALKFSNEAWAQILGVLISMWDCGIANYNVEIYEVNGVRWVDGCVTDGEQAFHMAYSTPECEDYLVCAQILTQGTDDVNVGLDRLYRFANKLAELDDNEDISKYQGILDYYAEHGTLSTLVGNLRQHKPSTKYASALYKI